MTMRVRLGVVVLAMALRGAAFGQAVAPAASEPVPVPLWAGPAPMAQGTAPEDVPTLTAYLPAENPTKTAVIVAPGGSYMHLSMEKEGSDAAKWLNAHGVAAFVLKYRLGPKYHHPVELGDAQRAIRTVRSRAAELGIDPDHVGMWGFSAGGHLAASAGTLFDKGPAADGDAIDKVSARPDFLVLAYPVITMEDPLAHKLSRKDLLGETPDPALVELMSVEKQVTAETPPTFLYTTTDDKTVQVLNSVEFYTALVKAGVPAEIHIFAHGPHGSGLAQGFPDLKVWTELLATWLRSQGFMGAAE
jgi:acetyl esterase/lipase